MASRLSLDGSDTKTQTTIKIKVRWGLCPFGMIGWNREYFFLVPLQEGGQVHEVSPKIQAKKSHSARVGTRVDICGDMDVRASVTSEIALRTFGCF